MTEALHDRPTPHLVVDADVLEANVAAMAAFARDRGVALRPHAKTHKSPRIAELQLAGGATGLTVATVAEAEVFADAGCDDLFIAYTVWVDAARGSRLRSLTDRVRLTVGVDSVEGARALATHVPGAAVLVEVDCGHHRSGVAPDEAGALAEVAQHAGLDVRGVFTFPGHSYSPGVARRRRSAGVVGAAFGGHIPVPARDRARASSAEARRRAWPQRTPTCSPSCAPASTCSATPSSGSSAPPQPSRHRADLPRDGRQPRRRPARARLRQQGPRRRPAGLGHGVGPAARPPRRADRPALRAPRGRRLDRPASCPRSAAGCASCPTTSATP